MELAGSCTIEESLLTSSRVLLPQPYGGGLVNLVSFVNFLNLVSIMCSLRSMSPYWHLNSITRDGQQMGMAADLGAEYISCSIG